MNKLLVVSDIHLGSPVLRADELLNLLDKNWAQIVVNGDLLDSGKFHRYNKKHWKVLTKLRKLSKHIPVHLIAGNHDRDAEVLAEILGLEYKKELALCVNTRNILLVHGDQFDTFISRYPVITEIAAGIYYFLQRAGLSRSVCRKIKEGSKQWLNASEVIAKRALEYILDKEFTDIITGHTHKAMHHSILEKGYWNSGTFCDDPSHYITICLTSGEIMLHSV